MVLLIRALFVAAIAAKQPTFVAQSDRVVAVILPASLLSEPDVQRQLNSGLTITFILRSQWGGGALAAAARIEIRYDLWDEVWLVRRIEFDGKETRDRLASRDSLDNWWSTPARIGATTSDRVTLNVTLTALPFSAAEGEDTRQWIAKSGGVTAGSGSPLITALIGTTLNAKPIHAWKWRTEIAFR